MFTGLIQQVGKLAGRKARAGGQSLVIRHEPWDSSLIPGESVAVQGACLTVTSVRKAEFTCDVLAETLDKTNLRLAETGAALNLERALRADDRLGGHIVTGHIDGKGVATGLTPKGADWILEVSCDTELLTGIVPKGSVTIDGVSLTVAELRAASFTVHLIPHTWDHTSLQFLKKGRSVNLETDIIGKYVQRYLERMQGGKGMTMEKLMSAFGG